MSTPFDLLGLPPDAQERDVRRAYARLLKGMDTLAQPQAFMDLRAAFEHALVQVRARAERIADADAAGAWLGPAPEAECMPDTPERGAEVERGGEKLETAQEKTTQDLESEDTAASHAPTWDAEPASAVAQRLLASMALRFAPEDVEAATVQLRTVLAQPALQGLQVREALEALLAQRLETLVFGRRRSALLLAADTVFDWRRQGVGHPLLESVLDAFAALGALRKKVAIALLGDPDPAVARALALTPRRLLQFEREMGDFFAWWLPTDHMARWRAAWSQVPWQFRLWQWGMPWLQSLRRSGAYVLAVLAFVMVGFSAFHFLAERGRGQEAARVDQECQELLDAQRRSAWMDVPASTLHGLERCRLSARFHADDLRGYDQLRRIQAGLKSSTKGERYVPLSSDYLVLNLSDGRAFGFTRPDHRAGDAVCRDAQTFARTAGWLRLGDTAAARALVQQVAWCMQRAPAGAAALGQGSDAVARYLAALTQGDSNDLAWTLLRHTDAWPDGPSPRLAIEELVRQHTPEGFHWQLPAPRLQAPRAGGGP